MVAKHGLRPRLGRILAPRQTGPRAPLAGSGRWRSGSGNGGPPPLAPAGLPLVLHCLVASRGVDQSCTTAQEWFGKDALRALNRRGTTLLSLS
jgi:hypothetical protein